MILVVSPDFIQGGFFIFHLIYMAFLATLLTWALTAIGAALVFFFKEINQKVLNTMLGFAAGVMIAASFWSLLAPAIERAEASGGPIPPWAVAGIGFFLGTVFLWLSDKLIPENFLKEKELQGQVGKNNLRHSVLLVLSITLHNIPEGLAVGVAFGAVANAVNPDAALVSAWAVAIGIGLQNLPEGAAVSIPLRRAGLSRTKSFVYGQASGIVEPIAGLIGAAMVMYMEPILPYALAFAAGAMIYVVVEELIPEAQSFSNHKEHFATFGCIFGFMLMMILDVALG